MPTQINSKNKPLKSYDAGDLADIYSEMLERAESVGYMIETLREEINLLPSLTGSDKVYFQSITRCLTVLEQLSYDNMQRLVRDEERLNQEWQENKKAVTL
ncbi:hypothetical protein [Acinetobacter variabilis]|uniref:hypothetical protein n=1 Tax=Acinetobacter variabilis TaxID=70346 RepID=UPI002897A605|nr:hypothetical protein [Acinetobacter variabilis]